MSWKQAIEKTLEKTKNNINRYNGLFPHTSVDGEYQLNDNNNWTDGFWSGILWLSYEYSKDETFKEAAQSSVESFRNRLEKNIGLETHDIGFLYTPSTKAQWMIEDDEAAKKLSLEAADKLMVRYRPEAGIIQAWGPVGDEAQGGRIIVDCLMNMPLLFWASETTGDSKYKDAAIQFVEKARKFLMRGDDSSYHTFYFDQETGAAIRGATQQGYRDGSTWTRGQAWAIYGFALAYRYTNNPLYLETSRRAAHFFVNHLPENYVAHWDFDAPVDENINPDSSASAIAACGMLELLSHLDKNDKDVEFFEEAINKSISSLVEDYATESTEQGLIDHGSYSVLENKSPDDFVIWGDYFYLEALMRLENKHKGYWY
ncbi:glycoside hydrolase family 88 protein [Radiobacillus sp. PE A8.2]|uniref:glycoside hydrolase family 88 protein n=1 Tax=Radiobacillus sp. PE A8.2 TaxID=3380349 RepID=UPI00389013BD